MLLTCCTLGSAPSSRVPVSVGDKQLERTQHVPVPSDAPPKIYALRFSSLDVHLGQDWSGEALTTSNVERLDLQTNLFALQAHRVAPGRFVFRFHILDLVPIGIRSYTLHVRATSGDGKTDETALAFRLNSRLHPATTIKGTSGLDES